MKQIRNCAVCGSAEKKSLFRQRFSGLSEGGLLDGYVVSVCTNCGFGFADEVPAQAVFDEYYRDMSKYERQHCNGGGGADLIRNHLTADALIPFVPHTKARILDIGCATGRLLGVLRERGYSEVLGIDPSPVCADLASKLYGVNVLTHSIFDIPPALGAFDVVTLISVIEHVQDLSPLISRLKDLVAVGGLLLVEHPDTTRFSKSSNGPFQEFSLEHINYFSSVSLSNLMTRYGFVQIHSYQEDRVSSGGTHEPSSSSLFRREDLRSGEFVHDHETEKSLIRYIAESMAADESVRRIIDELVDSAAPIIVWGVGTHTQRLMATSRLKDANIRAFVDSNVRYQGKSLNGIPIMPPEVLREMSEPVMISSPVFHQEIARQMRENLKVENRAILLY